jgi:hypothetical protein
MYTRILCLTTLKLKSVLLPFALNEGSFYSRNFRFGTLAVIRSTVLKNHGQHKNPWSVYRDERVGGY